MKLIGTAQFRSNCDVLGQMKSGTKERLESSTNGAIDRNHEVAIQNDRPTKRNCSNIEMSTVILKSTLKLVKKLTNLGVRSPRLSPLIGYTKLINDEMTRYINQTDIRARAYMGPVNEEKSISGGTKEAVCKKSQKKNMIEKMSSLPDDEY